MNMIQLILDKSIESLIHKAITNGLTDKIVEYNLHNKLVVLLSDLLQSYERIIRRMTQRYSD